MRYHIKFDDNHGEIVMPIGIDGNYTRYSWQRTEQGHIFVDYLHVPYCNPHFVMTAGKHHMAIAQKARLT